MRELWLVMRSQDGGQTWQPDTNQVDFREVDGAERAKKASEQAHGRCLYKAVKFIGTWDWTPKRKIPEGRAVAGRWVGSAKG
jgi:hypothetical protein